jgi:hypothetical protein
MMKSLLRKALNPSFTDTMAGLERKFQRQDRKYAVVGQVVTSPEDVAEVLTPNYDPDTAPRGYSGRKVILIATGTAFYVYVYAAGILYV